VRFIAEIFRDVINKYAIPELCNYNWPGVKEYPQLRVRRLGDTIDWRAMSFAIRNLIGAKVITPDDQLEAFFRDEMDLPKADYLSQPEYQGPRNTDAPQAGSGVGSNFNPGANGKPKQVPATQMGIGPGSSGRVGRDGGSP
jgi:hypothetical protein